MRETPVISVIICTYNHEDYLEKAILSVLDQEIDSRYEVLIGDDCSNDRTLKIAYHYQSLYPKVIRVFENTTNLGSTRNLLRLIFASQGDFIAILDGDDYWSSSDKLKKQMQVMNNRPNFGMVCSYALTLDDKNQTIIGRLGSDAVESFEKLIRKDDDVAAPTLFLKKELLLQCVKDSDWYISHNCFFDSVISYWFSYYSSICFIPEDLAVYRVRENSSCHSTDEKKLIEYDKRYFSIKLKFLLDHIDSVGDVHAIICEEWEKARAVASWKSEIKVRDSIAYRIGRAVLFPIKLINNLNH